MSGQVERRRARSRRAFGAKAATVAIMVVVLSAAWLLFGFSARAQEGHRSALAAAQMASLVEDLHATESEVNAGEVTPAAARTEIRGELVQANRLIGELSAHGVVGPEAGTAFRELRAALDLQFDLLTSGETEAADHVDHARVDPAFGSLHRQLERATARAIAAADSAARWLRNGSVFVLLIAGGLVAVIARRSHLQAVASLAEQSRVVESSERRFRALIDNGDDVIIVTDRNAAILEISNSVDHVLGLQPQSRVGRKVTDLVHPDEVTAAESEFERTISTGNAGPSEWRCRDGDGEWRNIEVTWTNMLEIPEVAAVVLNLRDITERHRLEEELRHRAFHDSLTGLANRALLRDRIGHAMASRDTCHAALMVVDLDGFKHLNDSLGHPAGDHALVVVADRLLGISRPKDTVARLGGDEFAILIEDPLSGDDMQALGNRLVEAVVQPFDWHGRAVVVGASVGVAFVQPGVHNADDLIRNADVGLYAAKESGRGKVCTFDANLFDAAKTRFDLESQLRVALDQDEFVLQYQPIVELKTGRPAGFEALVRWQNPTRGMLRPDDFIPIAEETGIIVPLGRWVLARACHDLASWTRSYPTADALYVSVNLSARELEDSRIVSEVQAALSDSGLEPSRLVLEITETALMHDMQAALARLDALKGLGIRLSVDDFGTGYSSLSYLRQFPIDTVKIDKSFVDSIAAGRDDATFVGAILRLSEALHLDTLAEGIETGDQADTLQQLGCHLGQGFHYAKPLNPADVCDLLANAGRIVEGATRA